MGGLRSQNVNSKDYQMGRTALASVQRVDSRILCLRDQKIILDAYLAELYGVTVKRLNEQVARNIVRFPPDFLFQLTRAERESLRSQNATSNSGRGGRRYAPYAFTEHGAIMAATVLKSERAIEMSVFVVRAFVQMRQALAANQQVAAKLAELEGRLEGHDADIRGVVEAIRKLMAPLPRNGRRIGFHAPAIPKGKLLLSHSRAAS
jgi:phage regulator Rha-like protein